MSDTETNIRILNPVCFPVYKRRLERGEYEPRLHDAGSTQHGLRTGFPPGGTGRESGRQQTAGEETLAVSSRNAQRQHVEVWRGCSVPYLTLERFQGDVGASASA